MKKAELFFGLGISIVCLSAAWAWPRIPHSYAITGLIFGIILVLHSVKYLFRAKLDPADPDETRPIILLDLSPPDRLIAWPDENKQLTDDANKNGVFSIAIENSGASRAQDLLVKWKIALSIEDLKKSFDTSGALEYKERDYGIDVCIEKPTTTTGSIGIIGIRRDAFFSSQNIAYIDNTATHNRVNISYPHQIQELISLFVLSEAYRVDDKMSADLESAIRTGDREAITKLGADLFKNKIIRLPTVTISIEFKDSKGMLYKKSHHIQSVYIPMSIPKWVKTSRSSLHFNGGIGTFGLKDEFHAGTSLYGLIGDR